MTRDVISSVLNLFNFQGRTSRSGFWLTLVGLTTLRTLLVVAANAATGHLSGGGHAQEVSALLFLWPQAALAVKRGHDLGRSARYSLAIVAATAIGLAIVVIGRSVEQFGLSAIGGVLWLWAMFHLFIEYGFKRGVVGPNRHGGEPWSFGALADDALPGGKASA